MRLTTKSFKLVADEDVRPFILTSQPEAGENLIGFISRVMADQAFSSLSAGLSLAGIGCPKPDKIASLLRDDTQIANLAKLLKIPVVELQSLLEPVTTRPGTRIKVTAVISSSTSRGVTGAGRKCEGSGLRFPGNSKFVVNRTSIAAHLSAGKRTATLDEQNQSRQYR
jgi:hypothetical protein